MAPPPRQHMHEAAAAASSPSSLPPSLPHSPTLTAAATSTSATPYTSSSQQQHQRQQQQQQHTPHQEIDQKYTQATHQLTGLSAEFITTEQNYVLFLQQLGATLQDLTKRKYNIPHAHSQTHTTKLRDNADTLIPAVQKLSVFQVAFQHALSGKTNDDDDDDNNNNSTGKQTNDNNDNHTTTYSNTNTKVMHRPSALAEVFVLMSPQMHSLYGAFVIKLDDFIHGLKQFRTEQSLPHGLDQLLIKLDSLLIMPVQRATRYKLFFQEMLKQLGIKRDAQKWLQQLGIKPTITTNEHAATNANAQLVQPGEYNVISDALWCSQRLCKHLNRCSDTAFKHRENLAVHNRIQTDQAKAHADVPLLLHKPGRTILREGTIKFKAVETNGDLTRIASATLEKRYVILYNDILAWFKPASSHKRGKHIFIAAVDLTEYCAPERVIGESATLQLLRKSVFNARSSADGGSHSPPPPPPLGTAAAGAAGRESSSTTLPVSRARRARALSKQDKILGRGQTTGSSTFVAGLVGSSAQQEPRRLDQGNTIDAIWLVIQSSSPMDSRVQLKAWLQALSKCHPTVDPVDVPLPPPFEKPPHLHGTTRLKQPPPPSALPPPDDDDNQVGQHAHKEPTLTPELVQERKRTGGKVPPPPPPRPRSHGGKVPPPPPPRLPSQQNGQQLAGQEGETSDHAAAILWPEIAALSAHIPIGRRRSSAWAPSHVPAAFKGLAALVEGTSDDGEASLLHLEEEERVVEKRRGEGVNTFQHDHGTHSSVHEGKRQALSQAIESAEPTDTQVPDETNDVQTDARAAAALEAPKSPSVRFAQVHADDRSREVNPPSPSSVRLHLPLEGIPQMNRRMSSPTEPLEYKRSSSLRGARKHRRVASGGGVSLSMLPASSRNSSSYSLSGQPSKWRGGSMMSNRDLSSPSLFGLSGEDISGDELSQLTLSKFGRSKTFTSGAGASGGRETKRGGKRTAIELQREVDRLRSLYASVSKELVQMRREQKDLKDAHAKLRHKSEVLVRRLQGDESKSLRKSMQLSHEDEGYEKLIKNPSVSAVALANAVKRDYERAKERERMSAHDALQKAAIAESLVSGLRQELAARSQELSVLDSQYLTMLRKHLALDVGANRAAGASLPTDQIDLSASGIFGPETNTTPVQRALLVMMNARLLRARKQGPMIESLWASKEVAVREVGEQKQRGDTYKKLVKALPVTVEALEKDNDVLRKNLSKREGALKEARDLVLSLRKTNQVTEAQLKAEKDAHDKVKENAEAVSGTLEREHVQQLKTLREELDAERLLRRGLEAQVESLTQYSAPGHGESRTVDCGNERRGEESVRLEQWETERLQLTTALTTQGQVFARELLSFEARVEELAKQHARILHSDGSPQYVGAVNLKTAVIRLQFKTREMKARADTFRLRNAELSRMRVRLLQWASDLKRREEEFAAGSTRPRERQVSPGVYNSSPGGSSESSGKVQRLQREVSRLRQQLKRSGSLNIDASCRNQVIPALASDLDEVRDAKRKKASGNVQKSASPLTQVDDSTPSSAGLLQRIRKLSAIVDQLRKRDAASHKALVEERAKVAALEAVVEKCHTEHGVPTRQRRT